jgi:hypothetical protein
VVQALTPTRSRMNEALEEPYARPQWAEALGAVRANGAATDQRMFASANGLVTMVITVDTPLCLTSAAPVLTEAAPASLAEAAARDEPIDLRGRWDDTAGETPSSVPSMMLLRGNDGPVHGEGIAAQVGVLSWEAGGMQVKSFVHSSVRLSHLARKGQCDYVRRVQLPRKLGSGLLAWVAQLVGNHTIGGEGVLSCAARPGHPRRAARGGQRGGGGLHSSRPRGNSHLQAGTASGAASHATAVLATRRAPARAVHPGVCDADCAEPPRAKLVRSCEGCVHP